MNLEYGKVVSYDGNSGIILDEFGNKYIFLKTDLVNNDVFKGNFVTFQKEIFHTLELDKKMARFIRKIDIN